MTYKPTLNSSVLSGRDETKVNFGKKVFGNTSLRLGLVLEIIEIDDEKNISKLGPEYNVLAIEQDEGNGSSTTVYKNCISIDAFGGVADYFQFRHRAAKDPKKAQKEGTIKDETGSIVLMLCLDGNSEKAVILKSVHNPSRNVLLEKDKEHYAEGEFNGVNFQVDKEGALTVTFRSATEDDGTPKDTEAGGTELKIEKDGSFEINDGPLEGDLAKTYKKPEEGQEQQEEEQQEEEDSDAIPFEKIRMDKTKKTIDVESREDQSYKTDKNFNFEAKESMNITLKKDWIAMAEGKAAFTISQSFDIEAEGPATFKAQQLQVESKSLIQLKAQSLYQMEAGSNAIIKAPQLLLGPSPAQPAILAYDLITLGTGNLGAPVISNLIAGYSTSIIISA